MTWPRTLTHLMALNQPVLNFYLGVDVTPVGLNSSCLHFRLSCCIHIPLPTSLFPSHACRFVNFYCCCLCWCCYTCFKFRKHCQIHVYNTCIPTVTEWTQHFPGQHDTGLLLSLKLDCGNPVLLVGMFLHLSLQRPSQATVFST